MTSPSPTPAAAPSRRERVRAATIDEIKQTALSLMRRSGRTEVVFSEIAREMQMTAPALYRYFADRDDLLTALITDTYRDLGDTLAAAGEAVSADDPGGRLVALGSCYRAWAKDHPERFTLLFGMPVPGYVAPEDGPTSEAAKRALGNFIGLYDAAQAAGCGCEPALPDATPALCEEFARPEHRMEHMPTGAAAGMIHAWTLLQGFVVLEAFGNLHWLSAQALDDLFSRQLRLAADVIGLPPPKDGWP